MTFEGSDRIAEPNNAPDFPMKRVGWIFAKLLSKVFFFRLWRSAARVSTRESQTQVASSPIRAEIFRSPIEPRCPGPLIRNGTHFILGLL